MQLSQRYMAPWEGCYERRGPIVEETAPPSHWCDMPTEGPMSACSPVMGGELRRLWDVVAGVLEGKHRIVDMGSGSADTQCPGAIHWDLSHGRDVRRVGELYAQEPFDLVMASHCIEHVPSEDVPDTLVGWLGLLGGCGEMLVSGPHICSPLWSALCDTAEHGDPSNHKWAATASAVGNFLVSRGVELIGYDTHRCRENAWWVHVRKP